jgi:dihydrofolate synthase/folylpolyglutamate synthase
MNYQETIDYLFRQLPMFQRVGNTAFKKNLDNILALSEYLGHPHTQFKSIHLAGTNGKGSTAHMLTAILQASGLKVGLYTSPHYKDFRERIKINGAFITEQAVIDFVAQHKEYFEQLQPSFFEITVAMAFDYFAQQKVDVAVIETGLGGRLDSTNIITPLLSIITNISFDHMNMLGNTLPLIAGEKAGIIKKHIPVVIGETHPETKEVFEKKAAEQEAPIIFADQHFRANLLKKDLINTVFDVYKDEELIYEELHLALSGDYQIKNQQTCLQSIEHLQHHFSITPASIRLGLKDLRTMTQFMGRWQVLGTSPTIICESAHNEAGIEYAFRQIQEMDYQQLHIVIGTVNDKDISKLLGQLPKEAIYYFEKANIPRGLSANILAEAAKDKGLHGKAYKSVSEAFQMAKQTAKTDDLIFVGGSIFVVAEVL